MEQTITYKERILVSFNILAAFSTLKSIWKSWNLGAKLAADMGDGIEEASHLLEHIPKMSPEEIDRLLNELSSIKPLLPRLQKEEYALDGWSVFAKKSIAFVDLMNQVIYQLEAAQEDHELKAALAYRRKLRHKKLADKL